jgi:hypothetical protein
LILCPKDDILNVKKVKNTKHEVISVKNFSHAAGGNKIFLPRARMKRKKRKCIAWQKHFS